MAYPSVDALQKILADTVFSYAVDKKKAAGRALGTIVEIITFYALDLWGYRESIAIERSIPEYANPVLTHNVEFSLHPVLNKLNIELQDMPLPITASKIRNARLSNNTVPVVRTPSTQLLSRDHLLRNACIIEETATGFQVANLHSYHKAATPANLAKVVLTDLYRHPFAIVECKRVGVEEGARKGPQTIEKAKQGAYVARSISSLQKIRFRNGDIGGVLHHEDDSITCQPYKDILKEILASDSRSLLEGFILTIGIVSNHGNWFTSGNQNKEMKVLSQSYDWLLFLTDDALAQFITDTLLEPSRDMEPIRDAFLRSYTGKRQKNCFTKVQIDLEADRRLRRYFSSRTSDIDAWFSLITPNNSAISELRTELNLLQQKNWNTILNL